MNIVNVGYDSTNYYVLADSTPRLLVDVGWPGTLPKLQHQCKRTGIAFADLKHFLITHYHPDHAGLAQELKLAGCKLILVDIQAPFVPNLRTYMKPENHYIEIDVTDAARLRLEDSRAFLAHLGIHGQIIHTPGHSDDSVTLALDEGIAFTGDLPRPDMAEGAALASWQQIRALGVRRIYPGHGPVWPLADESPQQGK